MSFAPFFLLDYWSYLLRELSKSRRLALRELQILSLGCYLSLIFDIIFAFYPVEIFLLVTGVCLSQSFLL